MTNISVRLHIEDGDLDRFTRYAVDHSLLIRSSWHDQVTGVFIHVLCMTEPDLLAVSIAFNCGATISKYNS